MAAVLPNAPALIRCSCYAVERLDPDAPTEVTSETDPRRVLFDLAHDGAVWKRVVRVEWSSRAVTKLSSKISGENVSMGDSRQLVALEILTITILCALATWSVRPLLEEWGLFQAFGKNGLGYILSVYSLISMRPLTLVPSAMQWLSGAGQPVGVGIVAGLLLVSRYFIVRWAVTPLLDRSARWIFATIATTLIGWPGLWLARFSAAQLSSVCFFAALGFCVRINRRPSVIHAAGAAACILIMLMVYEALALAVLAIPLLAFLQIPEGGENSIKGRLLRMIRVGWPLFAGFLLYALYCVIAYASVSGVYEVVLLGRPDSYITSTWIWTNIRTAYGTVFLGNNLYLSTLILILGCIIVYDKQLAYKPMSLISISSVCILLLLSLPLFSLTYVNILHLRDPERVLFPVSVGFALLPCRFATFFNAVLELALKYNGRSFSCSLY